MANKAKASHILVKTEEQAREILKKLDGGESFEKLAMENSLCPSRKRGGSLGEFGRGQMVREFEDAVFSAKRTETAVSGAPKTEGFRAKGQIILVKTQFGWHIIRVDDLRG